MKGTELRIGNVVYVNNAKYHPQLKDIVMLVTSIVTKSNNEYSIGIEFFDKVKNTYYEYYCQYDKYIKPIPLNEEWLLKLGLDINKESGTGYAKKRGFGLWLDHGKIIYYSVNTMTLVTEVHQLQNIYFALMGKELNQ